MDLKGFYKGHRRRGGDGSRALPRRRREVPRGVPRGPGPERRDPGGPRAPQGPGHLGRAAALARRRQGARAAQGDQLEAVAVRLARGAARRLRVLRARTGSRSTAAARARSDSAAARSSTWLRSTTRTRRTTPRRRATTTRPSPRACPRARWTRCRRRPGFAGARPAPPGRPPPRGAFFHAFALPRPDIT